MTMPDRPVCGRKGCERPAWFIVGDGEGGMPRAASCREDLVFSVQTMARAYGDHEVLVVVIWHEGGE